MNEKLNEALDYISDEKIAEAAAHKKRRNLRWVGAVAAVLAVAIIVSALMPATAQAEGLIAGPEYPEMAPYPDESKYYESNDWDAFDAEYSAWRTDIMAQQDQPEGYADSLESYFRAAIPAFLSGSEGNAVCSPVNVYMALAMLAEATGGESRQQILDLLGADSMESLRAQASQVWNAHYLDDGASATILANSLWLDEGLQYNMDTVSTLADSYYASVWQGDLGSHAMNTALQTWLNEQTGGLLTEQSKNVTLDPETVLAIASTVYFRAKWTDEFSEGGNTQDIFHAPGGDTTVTYMNRTMSYGPYYWGEDYSAVCLGLKDGSKMWLILPTEGLTPEDILESGHALDMVLGGSTNYTAIKVNLSLPKFDVTASRDLGEPLQDLGITDVFSDAADFSAILPQDPAFLSTVSHAARVKIDEEGVEAAAYTVMAACGTALPPDEEVDFVLDRPFLFVIASHDDLPLFAGIVNES